MKRKSTLCSTPGAVKGLGVVLLMVCSMLGTLAIVEGTLRLVPNLLPEGTRLRIHWQAGDSHWYQPHPYIGHLHRADSHASGQTARPGLEADGTRGPWGFRNPWPWPDQVDIIAVGDSLTYSQMVNDDQAWTTLLAQGLPQRRVLNLGLIGAAPQQYLRLYETFGIERAPRCCWSDCFWGMISGVLDSLITGGRLAGQGLFLSFGREICALEWVAGFAIT